MSASIIFNFVATEFVSVNNFFSLVQCQSPTINANSCHAVKIRAVFNHGKSFGVEDMHTTKLVGDDGEKFIFPVAEKKFFSPANMRAIFFVQAADKTSEYAISRNHQLLPTVNNAFNRQG